jgi:hypothetical protein
VGPGGSAIAQAPIAGPHCHTGLTTTTRAVVTQLSATARLWLVFGSALGHDSWALDAQLPVDRRRQAKISDVRS